MVKEEIDKRFNDRKIDQVKKLFNGQRINQPKINS